jgi:hypothetical protein
MNGNTKAALIIGGVGLALLITIIATGTIPVIKGGVCLLNER